MALTKVVFRLKRLWEIGDKTVDLYKEIKSGKKTSEFRDFTAYWEQRLCPGLDFLKLPYPDSSNIDVDITKFLKVKTAWFTVGYPKNNLPRLEAEITKLILHFETDQFEIQFQNVKEVKCMHATNLGLEGIPDPKLAELIEGGVKNDC